ncbi:hypothetical protein ACSSS7_007836 [Eimeria intestinalis]
MVGVEKERDGVDPRSLLYTQLARSIVSAPQRVLMRQENRAVTAAPAAPAAVAAVAMLHQKAFFVRRAVTSPSSLSPVGNACIKQQPHPFEIDKAKTPTHHNEQQLCLLHDIARQQHQTQQQQQQQHSGLQQQQQYQAQVERALTIAKTAQPSHPTVQQQPQQQQQQQHSTQAPAALAAGATGSNLLLESAGPKRQALSKPQPVPDGPWHAISQMQDHRMDEIRRHRGPKETARPLHSSHGIRRVAGTTHTAHDAHIPDLNPKP